MQFGGRPIGFPPTQCMPQELDIASRTAARTPRGYAPALDGVRALAVVAVIVYHAGASWLPGGFLGVDVFFVMSGYLVTALMQRERDRAGRICLTAFWVRRARRLLPALVLMLVVVCSLAFGLERDLNAGLRTQVLGALTYSSNWLQISAGASYVEHSTPALLTHLWSLAVEEQFYLIWPLVISLLLAHLHRRNPRVAAVLGIGALSALAMAVFYRSGYDPTRVYTGTDTHGFSLMLGAALALARPASLVDPVRRGGRIKITARQWVLGPLSLLVLLVCMTTLSDTGSSTYRGGLLIAAVAATGLVSVAARGDGPLNWLLKLRPMRWLGVRSYSLYLWHWPMLVIAGRVFPGQWLDWIGALVAIAASLLLSDISWKLLEDPIRRYGFLGYCRRLRIQLFGRDGTPRTRRSLAWGVSTIFAATALTAACGVVVAPTKTSLELQIEAGRQAVALAQQIQLAAAPLPIPAAGKLGEMMPPGGDPGRTEMNDAQPADPPLGGAPTASSEPQTAPAPPTDVSSPTAPVPAAPGPVALMPDVAGPAVAASAAPAAAVPAAPAVATGDQVTAIGDSVMLGSAPQMLSRLPGVDIDAVVSRQIWDLGPVLQQRQDAETLRPYLVIGLGTNGAASVTDILAALGPAGPDRVIVLVNTFEDRDWQNVINANLAAAAAARPHTCVADWYSEIAANQGLLGPDGVHPRPDGAVLYSDLMGRVLEACQ